MIFVQFNENVENETTGHELWPGFCSNQFKSSKCDLASKIILFIQKMSKPKIGDLGNGVCVHMIPIVHLYFPRKVSPTMTINCLLFGKHKKVEGNTVWTLNNAFKGKREPQEILS